MLSFKQDPYLWVHLAGLAMLPILLDICLAGLAVGDPIMPVWLEMGLLIALGSAPIFWMQWTRPFYIFSLMLLAVKPGELTDDQRRILRLFRTKEVRLLTTLVAILLAWVLWQLYRIAPVAAGITPLSTSSRGVGLLVAGIAFFASNLFLQVPASVARVLIVSNRAFADVDPFEFEQIPESFSLFGFRLNGLLPEIVGEPPIQAELEEPSEETFVESDIESQPENVSTTSESELAEDLVDAELEPVALEEPSVAVGVEDALSDSDLEASAAASDSQEDDVLVDSHLEADSPEPASEGDSMEAGLDASSTEVVLDAPLVESALLDGADEEAPAESASEQIEIVASGDTVASAGVLDAPAIETGLEIEAEPVDAATEIKQEDAEPVDAATEVKQEDAEPVDAATEVEQEDVVISQLEEEAANVDVDLVDLPIQSDEADPISIGRDEIDAGANFDDAPSGSELDDSANDVEQESVLAADQQGDAEQKDSDADVTLEAAPSGSELDDSASDLEQAVVLTAEDVEEDFKGEGVSEESSIGDISDASLIDADLENSSPIATIELEDPQIESEQEDALAEIELENSQAEADLEESGLSKLEVGDSPAEGAEATSLTTDELDNALPDDPDLENSSIDSQPDASASKPELDS